MVRKIWRNSFSRWFPEERRAGLRPRYSAFDSSWLITAQSPGRSAEAGVGSAEAAEADSRVADEGPEAERSAEAADAADAAGKAADATDAAADAADATDAAADAADATADATNPPTDAADATGNAADATADATADAAADATNPPTDAADAAAPESGDSARFRWEAENEVVIVDGEITQRAVIQRRNIRWTRHQLHVLRNNCTDHIPGNGVRKRNALIGRSRVERRSAERNLSLADRRHAQNAQHESQPASSANAYVREHGELLGKEAPLNFSCPAQTVAARYLGT
jgi:hypothetical protein